MRNTDRSGKISGVAQRRSLGSPLVVLVWCATFWRRKWLSSLFRPSIVGGGHAHREHNLLDGLTCERSPGACALALIMANEQKEDKAMVIFTVRRVRVRNVVLHLLLCVILNYMCFLPRSFALHG